MMLLISLVVSVLVAPARERGLKCPQLKCKFCQFGRSREGAWIEITVIITLLYSLQRRSREGAWIEILYREKARSKTSVAPARERGLKYSCYGSNNSCSYRRSREGAWIEILLF